MFYRLNCSLTFLLIVSMKLDVIEFKDVVLLCHKFVMVHLRGECD